MKKVMSVPLFIREFQNESHKNKVPDADNINSSTSILGKGLHHITSFEDLSHLDNATVDELLNLSYVLLEDTLWPSLQPPNWSTGAAKLLSQPTYAVMLTLCILALVMNIISIVAIFHIRQKLTTHLKLIVSLGSADVLIILSVLLHIINKAFNSPVPHFGIHSSKQRIVCGCIAATINSINIFAFLVSLLNLQAMAVDHYIGILHPWCYRKHLMSQKKVYIVITFLWVISAIGGFSNFILGFPGYKSKENVFNYCEYIMYDNFHAEYLVFGVTLLCLCMIVFIYTRIYLEVKRIQSRTPSFPDETIQNRKAMVTTLLVIGTFSICWVPNCVFQIYMILKIQYDSKDFHELFSTYLLISKYLYILILLHCLFDPIIYAIRLKIVQKGYNNFIQKVAQKFYSLRKCAYLSKCRRRLLARNQTQVNDHEFEKVFRHRPSTLPLINSEDASENHNDINRNDLEANIVNMAVNREKLLNLDLKESVI